MKTTDNLKLDGLLEKELRAVRRTVDRLTNGRTKLAKFLGIRQAEVSRYLTSGQRKPSGPVLAGMRAFVAKHAITAETLQKDVNVTQKAMREGNWDV